MYMYTYVIIIIIIRQPLCPVVGRRPQHVVSKWPCLVLSSAISCRSSICAGRLSTAWLVSLVVFSCHMVSKWWHARSIGRLWGGWYTLFAVYYDELIAKLARSGYGCRISQHFVGALSYADDITLLSPSLQGLQYLVNICEEYGKEFHVTFNDKKTTGMVFGAINGNCKAIQVSGNNVDWVTNARHLGNVVIIIIPHRGKAQMAYNYCFPTRTMF